MGWFNQSPNTPLDLFIFFVLIALGVWAIFRFADYLDRLEAKSEEKK